MGGPKERQRLSLTGGKQRASSAATAICTTYLKKSKRPQIATIAAWNKKQMELANAIKSQYIVDIQNGVYGFKDLSRTRKLGFIDYLQRMSDDYAKTVDENKRGGREPRGRSRNYSENLFRS